MKNCLIYLFAITMVMVSCEEVVDVDLETSDPRLVIDAGIEWRKGTDGSQQSIRLSTTSGYYDAEVPPVLGAQVFVTNVEGTVFDFVEVTGTGEYRCTNFVAVINAAYELTVIIDGNTYKANERLISVPEIGSIEQEEDGGFLGDEMEVTFYFQDNGAEDNFYLTRYWTDFLIEPEYAVNSDEFTQGNEMFDRFSHEDLESGNRLDLALYGISERFYNYMSLILETEGGAFQTPPANIRGNIINVTDESDYAYGYFRLSEVDRRLYEVR
ncbi:MAG: DUF4249 domain-containing protein [Sediminicola sp.]